MQFHPLTAQPDEWLFEARQLTKLDEPELVVTEHRLPADITEPFEPDGARRRSDLRAGLGLEPKGKASLRRTPPGRRQHSESGLLQDRGTVAEEGEDAGGVGRLAGRGHLGQRRAEGGYEPGGPAEPTEELFVGVRYVTLEGGELGTVGPYGGGGHEQARIVHRLKSELDPPFVDGFGPALRTTALGPIDVVVHSLLEVLVILDRRDDPEACPHRLGERGRRGMPGVQISGEHGELVVVSLH